MSEPGTLKPISEVLRSRRFQKEVSLLLFFFAALSAIYCVFLLAAKDSGEDVLVAAVDMLVQTIVYSVLAILIRRGSVKALVFTGFLFALNIVHTLFGPSWEAAKGMVIADVLLIGVLIRFVRRERRADASEAEL